jgi:hypothetical protein
MSTPTNTVIGYIVDVQGSLLTATLVEDEQGHAPTVTIGDEDISVGQLGSYVAIRQNAVYIIAIVTRMTEQEALASPTIETPGEDTARLPFAKRIARLTPIGSIKADGQFDRGIGQYPTTGAEVHAIGSADIAKMFDRFQSKGFSVGTVATHPSLKVCLDPSNLFGRHFAILGQTGSGKSWTVAALVQRAVAVMPRAHIIILDLHGEYSYVKDGKREYAFKDADVRHVDATSLEMPYWLMTYAELTDLLVDQSDFSAHNQVAVFRDIVGELRTDEGRKIGIERPTVDTPVWFDLGALRIRIEQLNARIPAKAAGETKDGPLTGKFSNFLMRLDSKLNDVRYDFLLKPRVRKDSASLSSLLRDFVGLGTPKRAVTVIDLVLGAVRRTAHGRGADRPVGVRVQLLEPKVPRVSHPPHVRGGPCLHPAREREPVRGLPEVDGADRKGRAQVRGRACGGEPAAARSLRDGSRAVRHVHLSSYHES